MNKKLLSQIESSLSSIERDLDEVHPLVFGAASMAGKAVRGVAGHLQRHGRKYAAAGAGYMVGKAVANRRKRRVAQQ